MSAQSRCGGLVGAARAPLARRVLLLGFACSLGGGCTLYIDLSESELSEVSGLSGEPAAGGRCDEGGAACGGGAAGARTCSSSPRGCPALEWVRIEGGGFTMGSGVPEESPPHEVGVRSFELMRTEVTVGIYRSCVEDGACTLPSCALPDAPISFFCTYALALEDHPVNYLSWSQLMELAAWLEARLPTEAEWEFAASSRGTSVYPWGDEGPTCALADYNGAACPVGTSVACGAPLGSSAQGVCDLAGNIYEWVQDEWHPTYSGAPASGAGWCEGECPTSAHAATYVADDPRQRVMRGGAWNFAPTLLRASFRAPLGALNTTLNSGGRLARSLP